MKTLRNLFMLVISILLIVPTGTAYAATAYEHHEVDVCVNNEWVDASVYVDENNIAWVTNYSQLYIIFPEETRGFSFPAVQEPSSLKNWAISFDYTLKLTSNAVYLFSKDTDIAIPEVPDDPSTVIPEQPENPVVTPENPDIPNITIPENVKLYVNGMFVSDVSVSLNSNGNSFVSSYSDLRKIFPKETNYLSFPTVMDDIELKPWADSFGYTYIQKDYRIYLSNNGVTPIEVYLNSAIIDFPDQQPLILNNRTMIPIRAVSESLGWNVSWGENVVTITNNSHALILYIGKNYYTIDSVRKTMDVPAQIMNGRTMVPIRFVAEAFGYNVGYDGSGNVKLVTISK